jgi:hypothetical protein
MNHGWRMNTVVWPIIGQTGRCLACGVLYRFDRVATGCPGRDDSMPACQPASHPTVPAPQEGLFPAKPPAY